MPNQDLDKLKRLKEINEELPNSIDALEYHRKEVDFFKHCISDKEFFEESKGNFEYGSWFENQNKVHDKYLTDEAFTKRLKKKKSLFWLIASSIALALFGAFTAFLNSSINLESSLDPTKNWNDAVVLYIVIFALVILLPLLMAIGIYRSKKYDPAVYGEDEDGTIKGETNKYALKKGVKWFFIYAGILILMVFICSGIISALGDGRVSENIVGILFFIAIAPSLFVFSYNIVPWDKIKKRIIKGLIAEAYRSPEMDEAEELDEQTIDRDIERTKNGEYDEILKEEEEEIEEMKKEKKELEELLPVSFTEGELLNELIECLENRDARDLDGAVEYVKRKHRMI